VLNQKLENEIKVLSKLNHNNIIKYYQHFYEKEDDDNKDNSSISLCILTEYCQEGDLRRLIDIHGSTDPKQPFESKTIYKWAYQLADALEYLHFNRQTPIIHYDIKPE
jgi:serine/threonine protein kinase